MQLARYLGISPFDFYKMSIPEAEAWAEAGARLVQQEDDAKHRRDFMAGDFDRRQFQ